MNTSLIFQVQSLIILLLIYYGVSQRKNRTRHVKIMLTAICWDLLLVLQVELSRNAIKKASEVLAAPLMLKVHLFFAVGSTLLFILMIITGRKVLLGNDKIQPLHKRLGWTTVFFRTATLITSYFAVVPTP